MFILQIKLQQQRILNFPYRITKNIVKMGPCMSSSSQQQPNPLKNRKINIANRTFIVQQQISSGAYGSIHKCKDIKSNQLFALKQIKLQNKMLHEMYDKQAMWLGQLQGVKGVMRVIGHKIVDIGSKNSNNKQKRGFDIGVIVCQYYQSNLFDLLKNRKFGIQEIVSFIKQMAYTLQAIHDKGCIHMDIKLQNILYKQIQNRARQYYICDFGSSIQDPIIPISQMSKPQKSRLKQQIQCNSTLIYRSPQMVQLNRTAITSKSDIWMLGCIAYMLLYRKHPFQGKGQLGIVTGFVQYPQKCQIIEQGNGSVGTVEKVNKVVQCVKGMLKKNVQERFSEQQILSMLQGI